MEVIIRDAVVSDIPALIELRSILLDDSHNHHYSSKTKAESIQWKKAYKQWLNKHLNQTDKVKILVGEINNGTIDIVSCVTGIIDTRAPMIGCLNGKVGWIQTMVVTPKAQNNGIGKKMLNKLLNWFNAAEVGKLFLQTTPVAENLYHSMGFKILDEHTLMKVI